MEEEEEVDLPEIEEDEIHVEEDLFVYNEDFSSYKETAADNEIHPKLVPLLLSVVFLMIYLTLVSNPVLLLYLTIRQN